MTHMTVETTAQLTVQHTGQYTGQPTIRVATEPAQEPFAPEPFPAQPQPRSTFTALLVAVRKDAWGSPQLVLADVAPAAMEAALAQAVGPIRLLTATNASEVSEEVTAVLRRQLVPPSPTQSPRQAMLSRAKAFIDAHLGDELLTPDVVAQGIFISKRYLHMLFQEGGESFTRYLINRRLAVGRHQLRDTRVAHLTVADIAGRVGFKDPSHFARAFKTKYGVTPSRFRRGEQPAPQLVAPDPAEDVDYVDAADGADAAGPVAQAAGALSAAS
ncbi:MAG TPA: AraC family transcriptional regulator [Nocardioides sp.]|uniref:helix-turn-helix transcriptional regulator n=1 Tax=uncultured Nocardioides sp. TaxID=198441 RepID=UPI00261ED499|nr:AraC family transcriptional regulator [uncultured Nocardioides sp.]HRD60362.1 AraC family transcriptional regulator [Nocardioides sp.]HRI94850.1 AraC family transcriptional regulator [Nocardioides sp.]HRK44913.1 AraC family transcriptional regulator [Nocardioides sp.]